jgi:hypothetical protein
MFWKLYLYFHFVGLDLSLVLNLQLLGLEKLECGLLKISFDTWPMVKYGWLLLGFC